MDITSHHISENSASVISERRFSSAVMQMDMADLFKMDISNREMMA